MICYLWPHSEGSPFNFDKAWGRAGRMTLKFSLTPFGLPGRLTIRQEPRTPTIALEIMAWGVFFRLSARIASANPGTSFSMTSSVASGVTSLGLRPVPPVVRIRSALS